MNEAAERALDRQLRIDGWRQDRLRQAVVLVVADPSGHACSPLASHVALQLAALGVGTIAWVHGEGAIEPFLVGPLMRLCHQHAVRQVSLRVGLRSKAEVDLVPTWGFDLVIDTSRKLGIRSRALALAARARVPYLSVLDLPSAGLVWTLRPVNPDMRQPRVIEKSGNLGSGWLAGVAAAALAVHETRRILAPLAQDVEPDQLLCFSPWQPERFSEPRYPSISPGPLGATRRAILLVGCGGIGTWAAYSLIPRLAGGTVYLQDEDVVSESNSNRQIFFAGVEGAPKPIVLAECLQISNPLVRVVPVTRRFEGRASLEGLKPRPDVIVGAVDSFATREILNRVALEEGIPYVDGSTDPDLARVSTVHPRSSCLCRMGIRDLAERERETARRQPSCGSVAAAPSIVTTNAWAGATIAAEVLHLLDPETFGEPARQTLEFSAENPSRQRLMGPDGPCGCWPPLGWARVTEVFARLRHPRTGRLAAAIPTP